MATIKFTTVPSKRLAASITAASSSIQVNNILGWDGSALTSSDFGTKLYAILRNDANTLMEIMELDPSTIASASITILRRGLKFTGDLTTEVTANKLTWIKNETIVELGTDVPQLLEHIVRTVGDQTIDGVKTFSSLPATTAGNPVSANDLARKAYVDSVVAGIATTVNVIVPGTAGETVAAGQLIYFDDTDNEWKLCDADTAATVENVMLGIAQGAGTNGNTISGGVLVRGLDANQSGLTAGAIYYVSNTAGGLSSSAGTKEVTIGFAYSTTQIYFNPRFDQQITEDQQDALGGNNGTPSGSNKLVTQSGLQNSSEVYAATATGNDTYVITLSPALAAYANGQTFRFKADVANTGPATLNINGLGAISIVTAVGTALSTGDIVANQILEVIYNSTGPVFQLVNPASILSSNNKLSIVTTNVVVANTTAETNLLQVSIPASTLGTNNGVRAKLYISTSLNQGSDVFALKLKYGSTTIATLSNFDGQNLDLMGYIECILLASGATNTQEGTIIVDMFEDNVDATVVANGRFRNFGTGTAAEDSTGALDLIVSIQYSGAGAPSANDTITVSQIIVEKIM